MALTPDAVRAALSTVIEPDLHKDLITLNMVRDIKVDGKQVSFSVVLTTPACPLKAHIRSMCVAAIHEQVDAGAEVTVNMTSNVTSRRGGDQQLLPGVRNTIAVASGKGGVGKSTLSANLAVALAQMGAQVGLVDTDIYGPSVPTLFGVKDARPRVNDQRKIIPIEQYGVKLLSMGFLVDPDQAVIWRGPMVTGAVQQFMRDAEWGELDYLIIDLPPGTGDIQLTLTQTIPLTGVIVISTPQNVALADARKGVAMFQKVNVPVLGIVENMAYFTPPDLPDRKYYIFGQGGAARLAEELDVPLLGEIPLEMALREGSDAGKPVVLETSERASAKAIRHIAERAAQEISIRNADLMPMHELEILYK